MSTTNKNILELEKLFISGAKSQIFYKDLVKAVSKRYNLDADIWDRFSELYESNL